MGLLVKGHEVGEGEAIITILEGRMSTKCVYGNECDLMVAVRGPGYHSKPHRHDAEQINYVVEGEMWVFVKDTAFLAQAGDFFRIPRNAVHWAWNRSSSPCTIIEVHAPPVDATRLRNAVGLYEEGEVPDFSKMVSSVSAGDEHAQIEQEVFGPGTPA